MKYRSSTEIIDTMLQSIGSGATRTQIMYKSYLSYHQLKEYLNLLQERDMIAYQEGNQIYRITENGLKFMHAFEEIRELVPSLRRGMAVREF
jgi:predicted transcriptional regulator